MAKESKQICITFDVDFSDYVNGSDANEMERAVPEIMAALANFPQIKTTWFVRIDSQIEALYRSADHLLKNYEAIWSQLQSTGHEIAWHHHAYSYRDGKWIQNKDEQQIVIDLEKYAVIAGRYELKSVRLGWGHCSNTIMQKLDDLGFLVDSSAVPRPKYKWENDAKDWSRAGLAPYHPSRLDYQRPGSKSLRIWEVPISTVELPLSTDNVKHMKRYINPTYRVGEFRRAVNALDAEHLVAVCHPYEVLPHGNVHPLLSFSIDDFQRNLAWLCDNNFMTLSQFVSQLADERKISND